MTDKAPAHQRVRFARSEIANLDALPSARGELRVRDAVVARRTGTWLPGLFGAFTLIVLALAALYAVAASGIGSNRMREEAERAIKRIAGVEVEVSTGATSLTTDASRLIALHVSDVQLAQLGGSTVRAGSVRFGVRPWPLLGGRLEIESASIADASFELASLPLGGDWTGTLRNDLGLFDPDRVAAAVFQAARRLSESVGAGGARQLELRNVVVGLPAGGAHRSLRVARATFSGGSNETLVLTAEVEAVGRTFAVEGTSRFDPVSKTIAALSLSATMSPEHKPDPAARTSLGAANLSLEGAEGSGNAKSRMSAKLSVQDISVRTDDQGPAKIDADLATSFEEGENKVQIDQLLLAAGGSRFDFNGAVGPARLSVASVVAPTYRYELVSARSTLAPSDSPEAPSAVSLRIAGAFQPGTGVLSAEQIGIKSASGEVAGAASVEFSPGKSPGVSLVLNVPGMQVAAIKQIWPWFAAKSARKWVLAKFSGGRVMEGAIRFVVPPGRLGDGRPLTPDEISGRFVVAGSHFDLAGDLPPMRDADGSVEFRGSDVDIALARGTVFLPDGKAVAARKGVMTIRDATRPPVIAKLDIDIEGEAAALAELASRNPINVMSRIKMTAREFSGQVDGHVTTDVPLQKGVDRDTLRWLVALDYKNLALQKLFDGQKVTEATGTIIIEPEQARIVAKAKLNGVPADLDLTEPLRENGAERNRHIAFALDDKSRDRLAPGLGAMISGPMKLMLDQRGKDPQRFSADLKAATLNLPWIGWSKGSGVAAEASFVRSQNDEKTTLSGFKLSGKSFSFNGDFVLAGGSLLSARLSSVRLNRDDAFAVNIGRSGKNFAIEIDGDRLDARPLIKRYGPKGQGSKDNKGTPSVSLDARIRRVTGFHGETLADVRLSYGGNGANTKGLELSAASASGGAVTARNGTQAGRRVIVLKASDAGAALRFLDIYQNMRGGAIDVSLAQAPDGSLRGRVDARDFWIENEPRLGSIVSTPAPGSDRSLNQAVRKEIDTSRVQFGHGAAEIEKGEGYLRIVDGVLRGPTIGTTFQGTLYDARGRMDMTGTFMPAYGLNRLFGELPLIGAILGNGRDRGLIGVTYRLAGNAKSPQLFVNPLSVIAPGIFRSIFEY